MTYVELAYLAGCLFTFGFALGEYEDTQLTASAVIGVLWPAMWALRLCYQAKER